jgi:MoaA/NifB/PqqE/SkfB family radical SAM enzyme
MPFCHAPWTSIDIDPIGKITPCCKFLNQYYDQKFNLQTDSINSYVNSEFLGEIKKEFQQGKWPKGCERCRVDEEHGIESKRQLDYQRWQVEYDNYNFDTGKFIIGAVCFGNTCNLKCISCGPVSSSRWQKEYKQIYNINIENFKFYKKNFLEDLTQAAPDLIHLDIAGGEPFLSAVPEQQELLRHYIENNQAHLITLHYTTNVTTFPDPDWWELWKHFKEIDMQLSIDGTGARQEYIRYPSKWSEILSNVHRYIEKEQQLSNLRLSVSHTVSAYNIYYLEDFVIWCKEIGLPAPWLGRVHKPERVRPAVWPAGAREHIYNKLSKSQHPEVLTWAKLIQNSDDSTYFEKFQNSVKSHDEYRGLDFKTTFPEMADYLK